MRYYYCVNCGHVHDYGFDRKKNIKCKRCESKHYISEIDKKEYDEAHYSKKLLTFSNEL